MDFKKIGKYLVDPLHDDIKVPNIRNNLTFSEELRNLSDEKVNTLDADQCVNLMRNVYKMEPAYSENIPQHFILDVFTPLLRAQLSLHIIGREAFTQANVLTVDMEKETAERRKEFQKEMSYRNLKIQKETAELNLKFQMDENRQLKEANAELKLQLAAAQSNG